MSWLEKIHVEDRAKIDTVQNYLIRLGIKPSMHLWEISIFPQNNVTIRKLKIINILLEDHKILIFKVIYVKSSFTIPTQKNQKICFH